LIYSLITVNVDRL